MVFKVSKGGVRSGNTLRGINSLRAKKYGREACLIARTSLGRREFANLVSSSTDDADLVDTLSNTDVLLSLNKRQRWLVPSTVRHMISSGSFSSSTASVSMLEKHKLKRRANCVNFVCNKGRVQSVTPSKKRYFCLRTQDSSEVSRREQKKRLKQQIALTKASDNKSKSKKAVKTVHTFTESRFNSNGTRVANGNSYMTELMSDEYKVEVFYPCPRSCSLTFNPKYTDVSIETNADGEQEVRSSVNPSRSRGSQNRSKVSNSKSKKTWTENIESVVDQDVINMWDEEENETLNETQEESCSEYCLTEPYLDAFGKKINASTTRTTLSQNILALTITEAEKAMELCTGMVKEKKSRKGRRRNNSSSSEDEVKPNNRVVFVNNPLQEVVTEKKQENNDQSPPALLEHVDHQFSRVILSTHETSPIALSEKYGHNYGEADCTPRRFVIDVTDQIQNILSSTSSTCSIRKLGFTSFLVFIQDGYYDNGKEVYRVCLNSYLIKDNDSALRISREFQLKLYTIDDIINGLFCTLLDMKMDNALPSTLHVSSNSKIKNNRFDFLPSKRVKPDYDIYHTDEEISRVIFQGARSKDPIHDQLSHVSVESEQFCDICYDLVSPSPTQCDVTASPGTSLRECEHTFCDACWRQHIRTKSRNGSRDIVCPGYNCEVSVGVSTLLTLVSASEVGQLLQRKREDEVEVSETIKWCPNPSCGHIIELHSSSSTPDVTCVCGNHICFICLQTAHWPATCHQAHSYVKKLGEIQLPEENEINEEKMEAIRQSQPKTEPISIEVEGRLCPRCRRFIQKNGGCPMMVCKCGHSFCWKCMSSAREGLHDTSRCVEGSKAYSMSRKLVVHHLSQPDESESEDSEKKSPNKVGTPCARHKTSMYQRALMQRLEAQKNPHRPIKSLTSKILQACDKDPMLKREVLFICGHVEVPADDSELAIIPLQQYVTRLLRSIQKVRVSLLHVLEYTFVLMRDMPPTVEKSRMSKIADDLSANCCFIQSVLEDSNSTQQDGRQAIRRLVNIREWSGRTVDALLSTVARLRNSELL